jgi:hypothetical protein
VAGDALTAVKHRAMNSSSSLKSSLYLNTAVGIILVKMVA